MTDKGSFTIDPKLIENADVRITEDADGDLAIEHIPSGNVITVDQNISVSDIVAEGSSTTLQSLDVDELNNADIANVDAETIPTAQGDGSIAMQSIEGFDPSYPEDVTEDREAGTIYQNTSGRPIKVAVIWEAISGEESVDVSLFIGPESDDTRRAAVMDIRVLDQDLSITRITVTGIVPDGGYYRIGEYGDGELYWWMEQEL